MNDRRPYRLLLALVIGLVLLNGLLLFWFSPFGRGYPQGSRQPGRHQPFLAHQLNFSAVQRQQYDSLRNRYFTQRRTLAADMRPARKKFFGQLGATTVPDSVLLNQALAYHRQLARIDVLTLRHFQQVAAICTPEQRKALTRILATLPQPGNWNNRRPDGSGRKRLRTD